VTLNASLFRFAVSLNENFTINETKERITINTTIVTSTKNPSFGTVFAQFPKVHQTQNEATLPYVPRNKKRYTTKMSNNDAHWRLVFFLFGSFSFPTLRRYYKILLLASIRNIDDEGFGIDHSASLGLVQPDSNSKDEKRSKVMDDFALDDSTQPKLTSSCPDSATSNLTESVKNIEIPHEAKIKVSVEVSVEALAPKGSILEEPSICDDCLNTTASHVDRHIIISFPENWPARIEKQEGSLAAAISAQIKHLLIERNPHYEIKITACDRVSTVEGLVDIFVYPDKLTYSIPPGDEEKISIFASEMVPYASSPPPLPSVLSSGPLPWKKLVLVCVHGSRDKRCGRAGPLVLQAMRDELALRGISSDDITVLGTSHIGGHKFAGTLIVYPRGQWYGFVTVKRVPELLDCIQGDCVLSKCFRGYGNLEW
jgi:(2Fe-2S) ferredoxin